MGVLSDKSNAKRIFTPFSLKLTRLLSRYSGPSIQIRIPINLVPDIFKPE